MENYEVVIIDPASTEFNRGSFCYLPYLFYSALKAEGRNVKLIENFTVADLDNLPLADKYATALWSYPQLDACFIIDRFLDKPNHFFGYYPLIDHYNLHKLTISEETIHKGIVNYSHYFQDFKYILLSDCDMHLKKYSGQVYPMFTSYGCPNRCSFCPSSVNCFHRRIMIPTDHVKDKLSQYHFNGYTNIHFTDEDFFFDSDRTYKILNHAKNLGGFQLIGLGSVHSVDRFIYRHGQQILKDSGFKLIEIGLETANDDLAGSMHKASVAKYEELAEMCDIDIFWLTLTFFPGETIKSLNDTGAFLRKYGKKREELYGRIQTNGTEGGLGQFFQAYHGTKGFKDLSEKGMIINERPVRLIPSFIPYSFLDSKYKQVREVTKEDIEWFKLYKVKGIATCINQLDKLEIVGDFTGMKKYDIANKAIFMAICARLGIVEGD